MALPSILKKGERKKIPCPFHGEGEGDQNVSWLFPPLFIEKLSQGSARQGRGSRGERGIPFLACEKGKEEKRGSCVEFKLQVAVGRKKEKGITKIFPVSFIYQKRKKVPRTEGRS